MAILFLVTVVNLIFIKVISTYYTTATAFIFNLI